MDHEEKEKKAEAKAKPLLMCEDCGIRWRHCELARSALVLPPSSADLSLLTLADGIQYAPNADDPKAGPVLKTAAAKAAAEAKAKAAVRPLLSIGVETIADLSPPQTSKASSPVAGTPPPTKEKSNLPPAKPCLLCKRIEPRTQLAQCDKCTLAVHVCE